MSELPDGTQKVRRTALVVLAIGITLLFLWMISDYVMPLLLSAIASGIFHPLYLRIARVLGGRKRAASGVTVFIVLVLLVAPATLLAGVVAAEALHLSHTAAPWLGEQLAHPGELTRFMERYPSLSPLLAYRVQIVERIGAAAGMIGGYVVNALASLAGKALTLFLSVFVALYALYFFLVDGRKVLFRILYFLPLAAEEESRMVARFLSVSRATIRGTILIGLLQGSLGGLALWILGVPSPALWTTIMAFVSALPGVGAAIVWVPAALFLFVTGHHGKALILTAWCAGFVGTVDNVLRPRLIGKDAKMPDLLILIATLGGIALFGLGGFILGPIVAALFITVWDIYGEVFSELLPDGAHELLESRRPEDLAGRK